MLIDPDIRRVEVFVPAADGTCAYVDVTEAGALQLRSIGLVLSLTDLFKGMQSNDAA